MRAFVVRTFERIPMSRLLLTRAARAAALVVAATVAGVAATPPARAAAPMAKTQAPGFYRVMLGDFELTALSDGTLAVDADKVLHEPPARTDAALAKSFLKSPVPTSVNAFLVNTGTKLVLVDTGTGGAFEPTAGTLLASLKASGYTPEQVDEVLITHMHGDHVGGLATKDGAAVFPNATLHAGKADVEATLAKPNNPFAPYAAAKHLQPVEGAAEIVPGVRAWPTPGHTPGHTSYVVESGGQKLIVTGDLIHVAAVQLEDPGVTVSFDADPKAAEGQRAKVFAEAAKDGALIAASHLQFPGMGHLRANGKGWVFVPVNYVPALK
jgi:glyoxylase-like metal-dependent hydrolase (beta-lactamase superfamily II)